MERDDVLEIDYAYALGYTKGIKYAEEHISDVLINRIIDCLYDANKEVRLRVLDGMSLKEAREMQVKYIKEHYLDV